MLEAQGLQIEIHQLEDHLADQQLEGQPGDLRIVVPLTEEVLIIGPVEQ